jgi:hypothetical protein
MRIAAVLALAGLPAFAQRPLVDGAGHSTAKPAAVEYLYPEQITLTAGKPTTVALHFRVAPGLHINSHTPREEELIPTTFLIPESTGVRLEGAVYPAGVEFALPLDPKTRLSVYTGEFVIQAHIVTAPGNHLVEAKLRYQACDNNECMPPRTITAAIAVTGK